ASAARSVSGLSPATRHAPTPGGALAPLRAVHRNALPPLVAAGIAAALLVAGVALRRRSPRKLAARPQVPVEREVPDARWLAAGEPKAVVARATWRLRAALARAVPGAHSALEAADCL